MPEAYSIQLWLFEHRDRAITRAALSGASLYLLSRLYDLSPLRIRHIVRKTCARVRPDWDDAAGYPLAWKAPLSQ